MNVIQQPEEDKLLISKQLISKYTSHFLFLVNFVVFRKTKVFRTSCFLLFVSSLVANSHIAEPKTVALSKFCKLQYLIQSYLIYTITTPSQLALNIILDT